MDRDAVLAIIDAAYAARTRHDAGELATIWREDAVFEVAGVSSLIESFPGATPSPSKPTVEEMMGLVEMHEVERMQALVEGNRAAILSRARVSFSGREPFDTLLYDLWELDDDGKVRSLLQFADTAKIVAEMQSVEVG